MDILLLIKAAAMGIVEGLTEFLPISSTGHLIVAAQLMDFRAATAEVFEVVIQLGAILAICWEYRARLFSMARDVKYNPATRAFCCHVLVAFLPAALVGVFFIEPIKTYFFNPISAAVAFFVGGVVILWVERHNHTVRVHRIEDLTISDAFKIGMVQIFSLIPGTSRSGSTIIGGLLCGLNRSVATEFSFFLAIPVMFAAALYDGLRCHDFFKVSDIPIFAIGLVFAFISAFITVRVLLRFVARHTFHVFAWYRIVFAIVILLTWHTQWIAWQF